MTARFFIALAVAMISLVCAGCGNEPPKTVSVRMRGNPPDARVVVDDVYVGSLAVVQARGLGLLPGKHTLSIEAPGYFPHDRVLELTPSTPPTPLDVSLEKLPE